jgi:hypothetical protein
MYLIQIMLPLYDNRRRRLPRHLFDATCQVLAKAHGGVTAYTRSPAVGIWKSRGARLRRDDIIVFEVMTTSMSRKLWARRRKSWERAFRQDKILIRALCCRRL